MLCPRCNLRETNTSICTVCDIKVSYLKPEHTETTDDDIIKYHVHKRIERGCNNCGSKTFSYEAGVNYEGELKWFVMLVDCRKCGKAYEEIMEVRAINESNDDEE